MKTFIFKSHRYLVRWMALPVILWALSGMMHPFMANWFKPHIAHRYLPPQPIQLPDNPFPLQDILQREGISTVKNLHLKHIDDAWYYQIIGDDNNHYYLAQTGQAAASDLELSYAKALAAGYSGFPMEHISEWEIVTAFSATYGYINRLLPVYRIRFEEQGGFDVYVDPITGKLGSYSTPIKRWHQRFFNYAHTWGFLGNVSSPVRITVVALFILVTAYVGMSGLITFFLFSPRFNNNQQRRMRVPRCAHRLLGLVTSMFFIALSLSGAAHTFKKYTFDWGFLEKHYPQVSPAEMGYALSDALQAVGQPVHQVALARIGEKAYYRLGLMNREQPGATAYLSCETGALLHDGDSRYAQALACHFAEAKRERVTGTELITRFRPDYSFIFKRLPVWRASLAGEAYVSATVDTAHSALAVRTQGSDILETWIFLNLHKFHFMDPISKEARDWLSVIASLLIMVTTGLGILLMLRRKRVGG